MSVKPNRDFSKEFIFSCSRSSGPGGQNVNKVNSKVELRLNISESLLFTEQEINILLNKLRKNLNQKNELIITSQTERSQVLNKEKCIEKFYFIIENALTPLKPRKKTQPSKASRDRRINAKKNRSDIKNFRRKVEF